MTVIRRGQLKSLYQRELKERGFREDAAQLAAVEKLDDLRARLASAQKREASLSTRLLRLGSGPKRESVRGLYLWGGVGRGKTWLMDLFHQHLPIEQRRRTHFHRFMHDVHAELAKLKGRTSPLDVVAERIAGEVRVLCFDELFVSDIGDAMILGGLFEGLAKRGVTLVTTSNVPPKDLYRDGLQRQKFLPAIALLERETDVINVDGGVDYRLRQLREAGTYLDSADAQSEAKLAALFDALSDGEPDMDHHIEIAGRKIKVKRESDNVIWFEFKAICEGPRGADDYIEIAREYQSVLVSNVPVFDEKSENAARRFIALVDEFYDRRVNLVVSAAATPPQLYRGERLKFEFDRTASRLIEMQSEDYLAAEHRA